MSTKKTKAAAPVIKSEPDVIAAETPENAAPEIKKAAAEYLNNGPHIYLGPDFPAVGLIKHTVIKDMTAPPVAITRAVALNTDFINVLVPVADLGRAQAELADRTSLLALTYGRLNNFIQKGV